MKKIIGFLTMVALSTFLITCSQPVNAARIVYDPTNYAANIDTKINTAKMLEKQIAIWQMETQNMEKLGAEVFSGAGTATSRLDKLLQLQKQVVSLSKDFSSTWTDFYRNVEDFKDYSTEDYAAYAYELIKKTEQALKDSAKTQGLVSEITDDVAAMDAIQEASRNASGNNQILQAANEMSAIMVQQLIRLQQIMAESNSAQANYYQHKIESEKARRSATEKHYTVPSDYRDGSSSIDKLPGLG